MKDFITKTAFVVVIAFVAGYGAYSSQQKVEMSDLAMTNVEALATGENSYQGTLYGNASGTKFCCCPGSARTCSASKCTNC